VADLAVAAAGAVLGAATVDGASGASEPLGAGAADADGKGPGLPWASLNWARMLAGTLAALGLALRHQTSDQVDAPRDRHFCAKPKADRELEQWS